MDQVQPDPPAVEENPQPQTPHLVPVRGGLIAAPPPGKQPALQRAGYVTGPRVTCSGGLDSGPGPGLWPCGAAPARPRELCVLTQIYLLQGTSPPGAKQLDI